MSRSCAWLTAILLALATLPASALEPEWISQTPPGPGVHDATAIFAWSPWRAHFASADGRFVVFGVSPGWPDGDVYVRDRLLGETRLISVTPGGQAGEAISDGAMISGDGRFVLFRSAASDLVADDANDAFDVFVRDLETGTTSTISRSRLHDGTADGGSHLMTASRDGEVIVFYSYAGDLVAEPSGQSGLPEIFAHDRRTGETTMLTLGMDGVGQSADFFIPMAQISGDGRRVAFLVNGDGMVQGDTNGARDIFVRDLEAGTLRLASRRADGGGTGDGTSTAPTISADGRFVVFNSEATNLVPGDENGEWDLFRFDIETGELEIVSADTSGRPRGGIIPSTQFGPYGAPMDAAGRRVAFLSTAPLVRGDDDGGLYDLYVRDMSSGEIFWISTPDVAPGDAFFMRPEIDASGRRIFFRVPAEGEPSMQILQQDLDTGRRRLLSRRGAEPANLGALHLAPFPRTPLSKTSGPGELFFMSASSNLADGDDDEWLDIYAVPLEPVRPLPGR